MSDQQGNKRFRGLRAMVKKAKTYSKNKSIDLSTAFSEFTLSPKKGLPEFEFIDPTPQLTSKEVVQPKERVKNDYTRSARGPRTSRRHKALLSPIIEAENSSSGDLPTVQVIEPGTLSAKAKGKQPEKRSDSDEGEVTEKDNDTSFHPAFDPKREITYLTSLQYVDPEVKNIHEFCATLETYFRVTKIAQGSYASILRMEIITSSALYTVWKLIPLKRKSGRGSRAKEQTRIEDAASELKALATMQQIPGFVDFRSAQILQGSLPPLLARVNNAWALTHPDDAEQQLYDEHQLWLLVEMTDAGTDLETILKHGFPDGSLLNKGDIGSRLTIRQTWDIFWGVTEALARGERLAEFEHRDLHPGNVCITNPKTLSSNVDHHEIERYTNLIITVIDYTLSRAVIENGEVLANSMKDPSLFKQTSDDLADARQYDMYRVMKDVVVGSGVGQARAGDKWKEFVPVTNVIWLYHILRLLLDETEHFIQDARDGSVGNTFPNAKEQDMATQLATVLAHVRPGSADDWQYLSATEIVDDQMGRLQKPFATYIEGDSKAMQQQRIERVEYVKLDETVRGLVWDPATGVWR